MSTPAYNPIGQGLLGLGQQPLGGGGAGWTPPNQQQIQDWNNNPQQGFGNDYGFGIDMSPQAQSQRQQQSQMQNMNNQQSANAPMPYSEPNQGGGNPNYQVNTAQGMQQNPSYQAQNSGTAQAQSATQPTMNAGSTGTYDSFINNLYKTQLGRAPDQAGLEFWKNSLASGSTPEQVIQSFQGSPEYKANQTLKTTNAGQNPFGLTGNNATGNQTSTDPFIQAAQNTAVGNYQGATAATSANRVNQQTPYSSLQYQQTGTDANGNPIWSANQSLNPQLQAALGGLQNQLASKAGQGINPNSFASIGINPGEMYSDAIMRRLQPQQQQQSAAIETQLANQGIMPGSEAYNRAKTQLAQQQNDQLTSAQVGGINVGLQANQQGFNQALQQSNLPFAQLGAFNQATQPGYVSPYNQQAVSGPDYLTGYTAAQNNALGLQNASNAQTGNLQSGLFSLAGNLAKGGTGAGSLLGSIGNVFSGLF